ncbi:MAG: alpha/beta fold hydrolase [Acidimicrobiales bacterium]
MSIVERNNVTQSGRREGPPMVFAHGYGCDQRMWRFVTPAFDDNYRVVLFDHVGCGKSDARAYSAEKYESLDGYARDVIEICDELALRDIVFVGHSVSAMIGVLAANERPELFSSLVLVGPSPRYVDDDGYHGGFSRHDVEELLEAIDTNYVGWAQAMAPVIMGNAERPELGEELATSFCTTDPDIARRFARATFFADNRTDVARCFTPSLVLQLSDDVIAPLAVGDYLQRTMPNAKLVVMNATGHCPNLSAPLETIDAIKAFLAARV